MQNRTVQNWSLVLWTTLLRRYHGFYLTILEIICTPLVLIILMVLWKDEESIKLYNEKDVTYESEQLKKTFNTIIFYPNDTRVIELLSVLVARYDGITTRPAKSEVDLDFELHKVTDKAKTIGIIIDPGSLPISISYQIRAFNNHSVSLLEHIIEEASHPLDAANYKFYMESGFLYAQVAVAEAFIEWKSEKSVKDIKVEISMCRLPYPNYRWIHFSNFAYDVILSYLYASLLYIIPLVVILGNIVSEKVTGIRELTKILGISSRLIWANWYFYGLVTMVPASIICAYLTKTSSLFYMPIFPTTQVSVVIVFFILCSLYVLSICCLYASLTSSVKGALLSTLLNWCLIPYIHHRLEVWYGSAKIPFLLENSFAVLPPLIIRQGFNTLLIFENYDDGLKWDTLSSYAQVNFGHLKMNNIFIILAVKSVIIFLIAWIIQDFRTVPLRKPKKVKSLEYIPVGTEPLELEYTEIEIEILNLRIKHNGRKVIQDIYMDIYRNMTTVLLGKAGSGKSSIIHAITGLVRANRGRILVRGFDVNVDPTSARKHISLCLEDNRFFMFLTVSEHLLFFAKLRGLNCKKAKLATTELLRTFDIYDKKDKNPMCLSGNVQRELCVSMALIGRPKIIILDEPTLGVDLITKKKMWNVLQKLRGTTTVLISSADMNEADLLGDHIAVFDSGYLLCYGTPKFLNKRFGIGYVMRATILSFSKASDITKSIQYIVPKSQLVNFTANFLKYNIPTRDMSLISNLALAMESKKESYQIINFTLQKVDIDDLYLKYGEAGIIPPAQNLPNIPHTARNTNVCCFQYCLPLFYKRIKYHINKDSIFTFLFIFVVHALLDWFLTGPYLIKGKITINNELYPENKVYIRANNKNIHYYEFDDSDANVEVVEDVKKSVFDYRKEDNRNIRKSVTGGDIYDSDINVLSSPKTAFYEAIATHSPAFSVFQLTDAIINAKLYIKDSMYIHQKVEHIKSVTNNPFRSMKAGEHRHIVLYFSISMAIIMCTIVRFYTDERMWGIKELQILYGVSRFFYWLQNYIIDVIIIQLFFLLNVLILFICQHPFTTTYNLLLTYMALGCLYILVIVPFIYLYHYLPGTNIAILSLLLSIILFGIILPLFDDTRGGIVWTTIDKLGTIIPFYTGSQLMLAFDDYSLSMFYYANIEGICVRDSPDSCCYIITKHCIYVNDFIRTEEGLIYRFVGLGIGFSALFFIIDYGILHQIIDYIVMACLACTCKTEVLEDVDVQVEKQNLKKSRNSYIFRVKNLKKVYINLHRFPQYAVKGVYFGVNKNEVFGVFGKLGSGKSTISKILSTSNTSSAGLVSLFGHYQCSFFNLMYLKHLSYCPQHNALNYELTCKQMLTFICKLRGIRRGFIETHVRRWCTILDMIEYEDVKTKLLNWGTKRKLCLAMALIGEPSMILLDEPTSNVDALCQRVIWSVLSACKKEGASIVIFTKSFEECEALCDRITMLKKGKMQCLGSIAYLQEKYNVGFVLKIYYSETEVNNPEFPMHVQMLKYEIEKKFTIEFTDLQTTVVEYLIARTNNSITVGAILQHMENIRPDHTIIQDYSCNIADQEYILLAHTR